MEGLDNFEKIDNELRRIVSNFSFVGELTKNSVNKIGNINDTYVLEFCGESNDINRYILQRVNCNVFKDPDNLMENISLHETIPDFHNTAKRFKAFERLLQRIRLVE